MMHVRAEPFLTASAHRAQAELRDNFGLPDVQVHRCEVYCGNQTQAQSRKRCILQLPVARHPDEPNWVHWPEEYLPARSYETMGAVRAT
jgi:hypothetical protein